MMYKRVVDVLKRSWKHIIESWWRAIVIVCFDLLFLVLFGSALTFFQVQLNKRFYDMQNFLATGPNLSGQLLDTSSLGEILSQQQAFSQLTDEIIKLTIVLFLVTYIIYTLTESVAWFSAYKISKEKGGFWKYFGMFAFVNLFWLVFAILFVFITIRITLFNKLSLYPLMSDTVAVTILIVALLISTYFVLISYGLIGKRSWKRIIQDTFVLGLKRFSVFASVDLAFAAIVVIVGLILKWANTVDFRFMMVLGILVLMPILAWGAVLQIELIKEIEKIRP